jgi:tRNA threonylcarbamoyladenosine biosynthesis protein TsaE
MSLSDPTPPLISQVETHSARETIEFGRQLASQLRSGDIVALVGELGAGKTCLVKGIALGLGITQEVTSPTFTLIHEYRGGRLPLYHVDLYRLGSAEQAIAIGIEDYLPAAGVTVIEWAERIARLLPAHTRRIRLEIISESSRRIEFV